MGREHTQYDGYRGILIKYDDDGNVFKRTAFKFDIESSNVTVIDPLSGQPIKKGEFRIVTDANIDPQTNVDKVLVDWREQPYIVGEISSKPKEHTSGRRGRLKLTRKFFLK